MQKSQEVCATAWEHGGPGFQFCSDHWLNLFPQGLVVPSSNLILPDSSLRTADAFSVVASLPQKIFRSERSDDRKCVCCSQANQTVLDVSTTCAIVIVKVKVN